jgi:uncharacterized protein YdeI (YjbR/CyaY-like superfamily)
MGKQDKRIDAYVAKSADFAKPILAHFRELVHRGCPGVEETMKWSFPHFDYHGVMCSMAAFKRHCAINFWKASLLSDPQKVLEVGHETAMGNLGRITSLNDLPSDSILISFIQQATKLNEEGVKIPKKQKPAAKKELEIPDDFISALRRNKKALATFEGFSYSNKKEYVEWISEAKTEETRSRRLATAIEWLAKGRVRNWKYLKK